MTTLPEDRISDPQHFNRDGHHIEARCDVYHLTHKITSIWPFGVGIWVCEPCIETSNGFYRRSHKS